MSDMQQEIRGVKAADHDRIRQMFRSGNFTPRRSWRTQDAGEMACSGLQDGAWQGLGVADEGGVLESYLDYKLRGESELQIGFTASARQPPAGTGRCAPLSNEPAFTLSGFASTA